MLLESTIRCPNCGFETEEYDVRRFHYEGRDRGAVLRPEPGDCCVSCSDGSVPCPPVRAAERHC